MAALDQIVQVTITQSTTAVAQASFGVPLIVGPTSPGWNAGDVVHSYSAPAGMLSDGYTTSSPEYTYALSLYAGTIVPTSFRVGRRSATVAQVDTLSVNTLTTGHAYPITVNGVVYTYTASGGDTQQAVLTALRAAIVAAQPVTGVVTGTGSSASLALTATTPGQTVLYSSIDSQLTRVATTAANGVAQDLAAMAAQDGTWYGFCVASSSDADILQAAVWAEGNKKLFVASSGTAAIGTTATTDVGSALKAAAYKRTALMFNPASLTQGAEAAWLGARLPLTPGSANWAFANLPGITVDSLTATQQGILIGTPVAGTAGKNVNIYQTVGGVNVTEMGTTASGQYIDITIGVDWLQSTMQTNLYSTLVNAQKVPYTDAGVALLMSAVKATIDQGVANGLIDGTSAISITAPPVASVPTNQRAQRIAPTISFSCRLAGALNSVVIAGNVSV